MLRLIALLMIVGLPAMAQDVQRLDPRQALTSMEQPPALQIFVAVNGQQVGPLDQQGFAAHLGTPEAAATTYVWMPGMSDWALASTVPALQAIIASMGQAGGGEMAAPADPAAFMLGVWVSKSFNWNLKDMPYSAIVQMKLLPDGRFEGATLFRPSDNLAGPILISHEKGTWTVAAVGDGKFEFVRNISYTDVLDGEISAQGRLTDKFVLKATGPNNVVSEEKIDFVRVPEGQ